MAPRAAQNGNGSNINLGALEQRVGTVEDTVREVARVSTSQIEALRQDTKSQFESMAAANRDQFAAIGTTLAALGTKIDSQQTQVLGAGRTDLAKLIGTAAGVGLFLAVLAGGYFSLVVTPITSQINELKTDTRKLSEHTVSKEESADRRKVVDEREDRILQFIQKVNDAKASYDVFGEYKQRIAEANRRQDHELEKEVARIDAATAMLTTNKASRDEMHAAVSTLTDRINALAARADEMQREFGGNFTPGDQLKNLQSQLDQLRSQFATTSAAAIAAAAASHAPGVPAGH